MRVFAKKIAEMFAIPKLFVSLHPQTKIIGLWCNGNTTDSGPVIPGSNPGSPTESTTMISQKPAKMKVLAGFFIVLSEDGRKKEFSKINGKLFFTFAPFR